MKEHAAILLIISSLLIAISITAASATQYTMIDLVWVPVPEPSSVLVLICGLGGIAGMLRLRKAA